MNQQTMEVASRLRLSLSRLTRRMRLEAREPGLSVAKHTILALLARDGAKTPGALAQAEVARRMGTLGIEPRPMMPEQFAAFLRSDSAKWMDRHGSSQHCGLFAAFSLCRWNGTVLAYVYSSGG